MEKAKRIITVSNFTKSEILNYFPVNPEKISVIPNGLDPHFFPRSLDEQKKVQKAHRITQPYLLYVGNVKPHKNITRMIQGYLRAWEKNPNLPKLLIIGQRDTKYDPLLEALHGYFGDKSSFIKQVVFKGYVPYEDLPALYSGAEGFLFPSLYEGFGFPPLEAMACGIPVMASNNSSLPEILNVHALFVDPYNVEQISSAILKIVQDSAVKQELILNGLSHVQRYSWKESTEKHLELYRQLESTTRNILFIDQYGDFFGGGQVILMDLIRHTNQYKSWKVMVALPEIGNLAKKIRELGVPIINLSVPKHDISKNPIKDSIFYFLTSLLKAKQLLYICRENSIDIIYCNGGRIFLMSWFVSKLLD